MLAIGCVFDMEVESTSDSEENDSGLKLSVLTFVATINFVTSVCIVALVTGIVIAVAVISGALFLASLIITRKCRGTGMLFVSLCFH